MWLLSLVLAADALIPDLFFPNAAAAETSVCNHWSEDGDRIILEHSISAESSGLVAGRLDPSVYYTQDDAGGGALLHLFDLEANALGEQIVRGATNTDWEDLAAGPCPESVDGESCLYIGDIGDNDETRGSVTVWVVAESVLATSDAVACIFTYEDGESHDAETLLVDDRGAIRAVTKSNDGTPKVYLAEAPRCDGKAEVLVQEAELTLSGATEADRKITGGAMHPDGTQLVLRSFTKAWVWSTCPLNWASPLTEFSLAGEPQGEAITFQDDGSLVTTSEGDPLRVWVLPCDDTETVRCSDCGCGTTGMEVGWGWVVLVGWAGRRRGRPTRASA